MEIDFFNNQCERVTSKKYLAYVMTKRIISQPILMRKMELNGLQW